ncbi:hypothetical protein BCV64_02910 [Cylindrospermopsis raciborskii MVCC14]|nr:hypothetical protein BCV64_02910 [Cylindrospermopsis raciborskii MVCC14]
MLRKRNLLILLKGKTERGEKAIAILENENVGRIVLTGVKGDQCCECLVNPLRFYERWKFLYVTLCMSGQEGKLVNCNLHSFFPIYLPIFRTLGSGK